MSTNRSYLEQKSTLIVELKKKEAELLYKKIFKHLNCELKKLLDTDNFTRYLISRTPGWNKKHLSEINYYDDLIEKSYKELSIIILSPYNSTFNVPLNIYKYGNEIPTISDKEFYNALMIINKKSNDDINTSSKDLLAAEILNKIRLKKVNDSDNNGSTDKYKFDEEHWNISYDHIRDKKVIDKHLKGKEDIIPKTIEEFGESDYEPPKSLISYINTTVYNKSVDERRKRLTKKAIRENQDYIDDYSEQKQKSSDPEKAYNRIEFEQIKDKVNQLKEDILTTREKEIIELRFKLNLKQDEVAKRLDISQARVSKILNKAIEKLKNHPDIKSYRF